MEFYFRLETLLALRRSREQQEELKLQAIGQRLSLARKRLRDNEESRRSIRSEQAHRIHDRAFASELHFMWECDNSLASAGLALLHSLEKIEKEFAKQQNVLASERQKREILETLRKRERERYRIEESRCEQSIADELFLMRRARFNNDFGREHT